MSPGLSFASYKNNVEAWKSVILWLSVSNKYERQTTPMVKDYLEVAVKNDEQLVKMATIVQRIINTETKGSEDEYQLSDDEKKQLLGGIEDTVNDLQGHSTKLKTDIDTLKSKGADNGI